MWQICAVRPNKLAINVSIVVAIVATSTLLVCGVANNCGR